MKVDINKIIKLRKANKLTISQMAKYLNKARCTVSCWEHNKTLPSKTDLVAIAQLLGTRISEISDYEDLPISIHQDLKSLKNKMDARSVIQNLNKIVNENKEIPETGINSLKKILHENNRLESVNRTLRKSNTRLISTMSSIHEIIYIKDSKGIFKKVNDKFLEQLKPGYTEEDVIGTKSIDIFGRIEFKEIIPLENKIFKNGQRIINEKIMIPGSVGKSHGLISIEPIFDEVDKVIEIAVSIKDITDIVENIGKLELLESVSNKLDEHIWIITENPLQYKFIGGKEFEKTYGILKNDFINNPSIWLKIVHPEDIAEYKNEQGKFLLPMGENTFRILHKDGSVRWVK